MVRFELAPSEVEVTGASQTQDQLNFLGMFLLEWEIRESDSLAMSHQVTAVVSSDYLILQVSSN